MTPWDWTLIVISGLGFWAAQQAEVMPGLIAVVWWLGFVGATFLRAYARGHAERYRGNRRVN